jgi:hypothetical protein
MKSGKQLYLENGWAMPKGFESPKLRDPPQLHIGRMAAVKARGYRSARTQIRRARLLETCR